MTYIDETIIKKIPNKYRESLGYYPDTLFYKLNQAEYQKELQLLAKASYIYSDGYRLKPVGIFTYFFQSLKGLFGLTNYCEAPKVQMALRKLAYYGYLKQYPQGELVNLESHLPEDYRHFVSEQRTTETSAIIQDKLIKFYIEQQQHFNSDIQAGQPLIDTNYAFGSILSQPLFWTKNKKEDIPWKMIPNLDPQDDDLITNLVVALEGQQPRQNPNEESYSFLPQSKYAFHAANYQLTKAKNEQKNLIHNTVLGHSSRAYANFYLARSLYFNDVIFLEVSPEEKHIYINYFLNNNCRKSALKLIERLDAQDSEQALKYVIDNKFTDEELTSWVSINSPLADLLAKYFLRKRGNTLEVAKFIDKFYTPTEFSKKYPIQEFILLVEDKNYDEAYKLFSQARTDKKAHLLLDNAKRQAETLANYFAELGANAYAQGIKAKEKADWTNAKECYWQNLQAQTKAMRLEPAQETRKESCFKAKRLYAELLLDDEVHNHSIENCNLQQVNTAIHKLQACFSNKREEMTAKRAAIAKGVVRLVDYYTHAILLPSIFHFDSPENYVARNQENFAILITKLQHLTKMLKDENDPQLKIILGKAYFLLGDISEFFKYPQSSNAKNYFTLAMKTVPHNPFYALRYYESFPTPDVAKLKQKSIELLTSRGLTIEDWQNWYKEHWQKKEGLPKISDIHAAWDEPMAVENTVGEKINSFFAIFH
jgi:hypothetical protein